MNTGELDGRVALVTGGGRGIGRAAALGLSRAGAHVIVAARTERQLTAVVDEITSTGGDAGYVVCDVTQEADVDAMVSAALAKYGRLDILVNNSGIVGSAPLLDMEPSDWDSVMAVNLRGTYLATRAAGRHFVAQGGGKVINMASTYAMKGVPTLAAYSASKAAVIAFTKSMAVEWARHNIQVNALAPGYIATDLHAHVRDDAAMMASILRAIPARRVGDPSELVPWLLLLAGPASDFVTGATIVIDGGQNAR